MLNMTQSLHKSIAEIWSDEYIVPLYQRNFAWGDAQIAQLLQDIYDHIDNGGHYYLGSLTTILRKDGKYEVIDGQQRLTALQIICKELGILDSPRLHYDSRPEVENFFELLFSAKNCEEAVEQLSNKDTRKTFRLVEALKSVSEAKLRQSDAKEVNFTDLAPTIRAKMKGYIANKVMLIRVPMPEETDVAAYFEIMNNRGEQLQHHEVIKALILGHRSLNDKPDLRAKMAEIWDECSQMNIPLHTDLAAYRTAEAKRLEVEPETLDEIIKAGCTYNSSDFKVKDDGDGYNAIVDFPNFLTYVFKLYNNDIELNGDNLDKAYQKAKSAIQPREFIERLLAMRMLFDKFVVRVNATSEEDEDLHWKLAMKAEENDDYADTSDMKRIVMQQTMLQVSFRNRKYKNWLFNYLKWLMTQTDNANNLNIATSAIQAELDSRIGEYYDTHVEKAFIDKESGTDKLLCNGLKTPHFLFNFIDYLYWLEHLNPQHDITGIENVSDFRFRYYNSIEHHRPRSYHRVDGLDIDDIGNLCLISRGSNSSMKDKDVKQKANVDLRNLQPKRRIMYKLTMEAGDWNKAQIDRHHSDIERLLDNRKNLML